MSSYKETLEYLFTQVPMFQKVGAEAYKPGLDTVKTLSSAFGNPHKRLRTIHIAGTNGKGSTAHTIAAILQNAGYRVGLFTSPHLIDFRERIRINGEMISEAHVIDFIERFCKISLPVDPSFFELTTIMAFEWFAEYEVDIAVIETGLGGRLDSTNIIEPDLCIITNISFDHVALLGNTLPQIATEKAGIIKDGVPVVIGEADDAEVKNVFIEAAAMHRAPIIFAQDTPAFSDFQIIPEGIFYKDTPFGDIVGELSGECQIKNSATIITAIKELIKLGWEIKPDDVRKGFANVNEITGLMGRWMVIGENPKIICDTGHNTGGWKYLAHSLENISGLHMIIGFVNDKDVTGILSLMPKNAEYYFTKASVTRAMDDSILADLASKAGLKGNNYPSVTDAVATAKKMAKKTDTIFIGGSTFVVADYLACLK